ncbi:MAG: amidohydrolase family protein [Planctomycetota bacterium]
MISSFLLFSLLVAAPAPAPAQGIVAIRVGRAESIASGTLEHAVILVEGNTITAIGEDLPIEPGIPILDRPDWVVTPGLVNCYSRLGLTSRAGNQFEPHVLASQELTEVNSALGQVLELGVTTLGLVPPGAGITGQAVAIRTKGSKPADLVLQDRAFLALSLETNSSSKKALRRGFEGVDDYQGKVDKERAKFDKKNDSKKSKSKSKDKDEDKDKDEFKPPTPDEKVKPFLDVREGRLSALVNIRKASDWLHLRDVISEEKDMRYHLRCPLSDDIDLYEVKDAIGELALHFVTTPTITQQVGTRRERNLPAELTTAGAKLVFVPASDSVRSHETYVKEVAYLVSKGLDAEAAYYGLTLGPATVLGVEDRVGSLEVGKHANLVLWNGDPFEPGTEIQAVMLEGAWVHEEDGATE